MKKREKGVGMEMGMGISNCLSRFAVFSHYVFSPVFPSFCSYDRQAARSTNRPIERRLFSTLALQCSAERKSRRVRNLVRS